MTSTIALRRAVFVLVALAAALRLVSLDADPMLVDWIGYITDEGRWVETARNVALFRAPDLYGLSRLHLVLSPAFQAVTWLVFELFGVGFWQARLFPALSGIALVVVVAVALRRTVPAPLLLAVVAVLGFEPTLFGLSRIALPELPALLFSTLAFLVLLRARRPVRAGLAAGVLLAVACGMKATTLLALPAFAAVAFYGAQGTSVRVFAALAVLAGTGGCALLALGGALALGVVEPAQLSHTLAQLSGFVSPSTVYDLFSRWLQEEFAVVDALLLAAWAASWCWLLRDEWPQHPSARLYRLAGVWALGWVVVWAPQAYLPGRYLVHLSVPLLLHAAAGLSLMCDGRLARALERVGEGGTAGRLIRALWLALPAAVLLTPLVAVALGARGEALSTRIVLAALGVLLLGAAIRGRLRSPRLVLCVALAPAAALAVWGLLHAAGWVARFWPATPSEAAIHALALAVGFGLAWLVSFRQQPALPVLARAGVALLAAVLVSQQSFRLAAATHLERDASRQLATLLAGRSQPVHSKRAASMFLETKLRYRDEVGHGPELDVVVQFLPDVARIQPPGPPFRQLACFAVPVHPRYHREIKRAIEVCVFERAREAPP